jgi:hypothetical protein
MKYCYFGAGSSLHEGAAVMKAIIAWFAVSSSIAFAMTTSASAQGLAHYSDTVNGSCGANNPCTITFLPVVSPSGAVLVVQKVSCVMTSTNAFSGFVYLSKCNNPNAQEYFGSPPVVSTFGGIPLTVFAESTAFFVQPNASPTVTFNFGAPNQVLFGPNCTVSGTMQ